MNFSGGGSQITGGISIEDALGASPTVGVRIGWLSSNSLFLGRYANSRTVSNGLECNVSGSLALTTAENLLTSTGADAGAAMAASTLYAIYIGNAAATFAPSQFRASATQPTLVDGVYYLGVTGNAANWRFLGWVATDASVQIRDDEQARHVVNYYNRRPLRLFTCPAYVDDNAQTTYAINKATFGPINAGSSDSVSWIANGEDAAWLQATAQFTVSTGTAAYIGPGFDSSTQPDVAAGCRSTGQSTTAGSAKTLAVGRRTGYLLACTQGTAYTVAADVLRLGAASDPAATFLDGWCLG